MSFRERARQELVALALTTFFFAGWIAFLVVLKWLLLREYHVPAHGLWAALLGALVLSKVVLVMERVPMGAWIRDRAPVLDLVVRTVLYGVLVLIVLLIEKAFETRHEYGGFWPALGGVFQHRDMPHIWVNTIGIASALFVFNVFAIVRRLVGAPRLIPMFFSRHSDTAQTPR
jgi:hypothetical protein